MRRHVLLLLCGLSLPAALAGLVASGCGEVIVMDPGEDAGKGHDARTDSKSPTDDDKDANAGPDVLPDYVDPGCPDAGPPFTDFSCDPYAQGNGDCFPGEGCYIFVDYPPEDEPAGRRSMAPSARSPGRAGRGTLAISGAAAASPAWCRAPAPSACSSAS